MNAVLQADKALLSSILDEVAGIAGIPDAFVKTLREKIDKHILNVVVAGEFKRGKSTLINALLGATVLPMGVVPLTSVITLLRYGSPATMDVSSINGGTERVPLSQLADFATERGNPHNYKQVGTVTVSYPSNWLRGGVQLVDTPGVGSVYDHNSETTHHYLPQADAVIFVISADQPLSRNELDFLAHIRRYAAKVFCVLNKVDLLSPTEQQESIAFTGDMLRKAMGLEIPVYPMSAKQALDKSAPMRSESGLANFEYALQHFLKEESERIWTASVQRQILQGLAERGLSNDLEMRAMELPLELLERHIEVFVQKKAALVQAQEDMDSLLMSDCQRLVKHRLMPDLDSFKQHLRVDLQAHLSQWSEELRRGGTKTLESGLEQRLVQAIRGAFEAWRNQENALIEAAFDTVCSRFWEQMGSHIAELMRYSAELFEISFSPVKTDALWKAPSDFRYKFWEEPAGLSILLRSLIGALPAGLSYPVVLRRARSRADELIETQAGRLRHDFEERLVKNARLFQQEMIERHKATSRNIEDAIRKGMERRKRGEEGIAVRRAELSSAQRIISRIKTQLVGHDTVDA